jgi:hypothetical protein
MKAWLAASVTASAILAAAAARADDAGASGPVAAVQAGATDAGAPVSVGGCVESIPKGARPPRIEELFPKRGTSGWVATLTVHVSHGKGERVLPNGLELSAATEAKKVLKDAGFALPEQGGPSGARLFVLDDKKDGELGRTRFELPLVPLPPQPGRSVMHLPPLPIAIARANGEIITVCTHSQTIVVEDPTSSTPEAAPRGNPPPRPQLEEWTSLKRALAWIGAGALVGAVVAYLAYRYAKRPRPEPPPPPPRPPWDVALEALDEIRHAGLLGQERYDEYFDRVSDVVRRYLGHRFGFDGLESTTDEILASLDHYGSPGIPMQDVRAFLSECDLVKFANLTPTKEQCVDSLAAGEGLVRRTMPGAMTDAVARRPLTPPLTPTAPGRADEALTKTDEAATAENEEGPS